MKKKKCEQYWPDAVDTSKDFEQMSVKFVAESKVQSQSGQKLNDLIHRTLEVTNVKSGNPFYNNLDPICIILINNLRIRSS